MKFVRDSIANKKSLPQAEELQENLVDAAQEAMNAIRVEDADEAQAAAPLPEPALPEPREQIESATQKAAPAVDASDNINIWDMGDDTDASEPAPETPAPATKAEELSAAPRPRHRARRNKTRILGFESQDTSVNALFEADKQQPVAATNVMSMNPTGWLIVVSGPGRGASFPLFTGMSQIGRGDDQAISLDFGDTAISRINHALIAYDPVEHKFYFGHGGKSNLVRLNGKPVLSTEVTKDGDEFMIGETTLRLRTLCGPDFNWETTGSEDDEHVAIA